MISFVQSLPGEKFRKYAAVPDRARSDAYSVFAKATKLLRSKANREAEALLRSALEVFADEPNLLRLYAVALTRLNRWEDARLVLIQVVRAVPEFAMAHENLAEVLLYLSYTEDAIAHFQLAEQHESRSPGSPRATAEPAAPMAPGLWKAWINLGVALGKQQKFAEADAAFKRALTLVPASVHALDRLGANAMSDGRLNEALAWLEKALTVDKRYVPSLLRLGHVLKTVGHQDEAVDAYQRCATVRPSCGEAYWSLANLKTFRFDEQQIAQMRIQLDQVSGVTGKADSAIAFSFALGKAAEDQEDYATAFNHYVAGNALKKSRVSYDPGESERMIDRIKNVFTKRFFESVEGMGCQNDSPILIVGLPRSGSTLLEQILASHSQVESTAELHNLPRIAAETGFGRSDGTPYPECMRKLSSRHLRELGEAYIWQTQKYRTHARYFTDKLPNNFAAIGFLHAVLPNAKVIDARRHPVASCLGAFRQLFASGQLFSYHLRDLAHHYSQYESLMDHWAEVLPGKVLTVRYEDVVDNLAGQAKRMAQHCKLDWEETMLLFHETERAIYSASSQQVRKPIYGDSVNHWRNYEVHLGELIDYLGPSLARWREATGNR